MQEGEFRESVVRQVIGYRVTTFSGSLYEVLPTAKVCRRLHGNVDPTPRQGPDGEWKHFHNRVYIEEGSPMVFDWDGEGHCTMTSDVVKFEATGVDYDGDVVSS